MIALILLAAAQDIGRLIEDLGRDDVTARGEAWKALADAGEPAVPALRKALYHEEPEIRVQAKEILKAIQKKLALKPVLDPLVAAVAKVRARWTARDFDDLESVVREAFPSPGYVHYVPKKEIGPRMESDSGGPAGGGFKPLVGTGGARDVLTLPIAQALDLDGLVFLDGRLQKTEVSDVLLFTLPDRQGWTAYVVVKVSGPPPAARKGLVFVADQFNSRLLAAAESRQVWGIDPGEIEWARANLDAILSGHASFEAAAGGGLRTSFVLPGGILAARGLQAEDVIRDINGQPVNSMDDLRSALKAAETGLRVTITRAGKPIVLEARPMPR